MPNKGKNLVFLFILVLIIVLAVSGLSFLWHSFSLTNPYFSLSLKSYDKVVSTNDACFFLSFDSQGINDSENDLFVKVNDKVVDSFVVVLPKETSRKLCVDNSLLVDGKNIIEAGVFARKVFFHVEKVPFLKNNIPSFSLLSVERINDYKAKVNFSLTNPSNENQPIQIFVNGELVGEAFFPDGNNSQIIGVSQGNNSIKMSFLGDEQSTYFENVIDLRSNFFIGALLVAFSIFVFFVFVFSKKPLLENVVFSLCSFFVLTMALFFVLNYLNALSSSSFCVAFFAIMVLIALRFRKSLSLPKIVLRKPNSFELFLAFFLIAVMAFNLITPVNVSFWTSFYERQSSNIFENNGVPFFDQLTNFGEKPYGYMSGYFFVNAGVSYLFGDHTQAVFALLLFLSNLALILSSVLFFRKIGLSENSSLLVTMLMLLGGFIIGDVFFNVRHIIALSLGFFSLYLLADKKPFVGGIFLAFSIFTQTPIILIFALIAFALMKIDKKDFVKFFVFAGLLALILFLPTFILHGLPTQAKSTTWGYLFGMPWYGVIVDLLAQIIFFFLIALPALKFKPSFDKRAKIVLVFVVVLVIIQLFVSYRVNIATTTLFAFLGVYLFPRKLLDDVNVRHLLVVIFVFGALIASNVLLNFVVPDYSIHASQQLALSTPSDSRLLVEPALGHFVGYFSDRKIMADLAVEYANEEMINDSFAFVIDKDPSIIKKHDIDYVFNRISFVEIAPVGSSGTKKPVVFPFLDKIYDDSIYVIHKAK